MRMRAGVWRVLRVTGALPTAGQQLALTRTLLRFYLPRRGRLCTPSPEMSTQFQGATCFSSDTLALACHRAAPRSYCRCVGHLH
eukprot:3171770-Pleurochrysis_carterae.AAC.2